MMSLPLKAGPRMVLLEMIFESFKVPQAESMMHGQKLGFRMGLYSSIVDVPRKTLESTHNRAGRWRWEWEYWESNMAGKSPN